MKILEGLILAARSVIYDGAGRALLRLASEPQMAWAAAVWMTAGLLAICNRSAIRVGALVARKRP
jgi:hypothetical protein